MWEGEGIISKRLPFNVLMLFLIRDDNSQIFNLFQHGYKKSPSIQDPPLFPKYLSGNFGS